MTEKEKIVWIVQRTGMSFEEASNSWALRNFEAAQQMSFFFDSFIGTVRSIR